VSQANWGNLVDREIWINEEAETMIADPGGSGDPEAVTSLAGGDRLDDLAVVGG
jgi:hypothetical protein